MDIAGLGLKPRTSAPAPEHTTFPNLLRGLRIDRPNQVWCADITYPYNPIGRGFLYLVAMMDWASRAVLAWRLSNMMDVSFCVAALEEALARFGKLDSAQSCLVACIWHTYGIPSVSYRDSSMLKPRDSIADETRRQILAGELLSGDPISERNLGEAHGVSRVPVREALIQLENMGLVRLIPGKGAFVRSMTLDEIRELYEVRESLEGRAVRGAAEQSSKDEFKNYESRFLQCLAGRDTVTTQELHQISNGFHDLISRECRNRLLTSLLSNIRDQAALSRSQAYRHVSKESHLKGVEEHLAIVRAIIAGDGDAAETLMRRHISSWLQQQLSRPS